MNKKIAKLVYTLAPVALLLTFLTENITICTVIFTLTFGFHEKSYRLLDETSEIKPLPKLCFAIYLVLFFVLFAWMLFGSVEIYSWRRFLVYFASLLGFGYGIDCFHTRKKKTKE